MPHYLVKGARKSDATSKTIVVHAPSKREAIELANGHGLFVASVEALDAGEPERHDAGHSSAIRPLCTMLRDAGRVQDGIEVLLWTYEMDAASGGQSPMEAYLRVPKYLAHAKRFDEAIQYLHRMKRGGVVGWPIEEMGPHGLAEVYWCLEEQYGQQDDESRSSLYGCLGGVGQLANLYYRTSESVRSGGSPRENDPIQSLAEVLESAIGMLTEVADDAANCERVARSLFKCDGWIDYQTATSIAVRAEVEVAGLLRCPIPSRV